MDAANDNEVYLTPAELSAHGVIEGRLVGRLAALFYL